MVCHDRGKGNLVVTCVGNETHGLGSRMVLDFLEMDGWEVTYLGADTPHSDIISMLKERNARALLVSVTGHNVKRVGCSSAISAPKSGWRTPRWWWAGTRSTVLMGSGASSGRTSSPRTPRRSSAWSTNC